MSKRNQRRFTQEFKDEAVRMVLEGSRTVAEVAREFEIHDTTFVLHARVNRLAGAPAIRVDLVRS